MKTIPHTCMTLRASSEVKRFLLGACFLLGLGCTLTITEISGMAQPVILPPDAVVAGKSIPEWEVECWKWLYSIGTAQNPLLDCEGQWATNRQPSLDIFMIAPVNGLTPGPCVRTFSVPEGVPILVPLLAVTLDNIDTYPPLSIDEMKDVLNSVLDHPKSLFANIDGQAVDHPEIHREQSPAFSYNFADGDNVLTINYHHPILDLVTPIIADGYWLMLDHLEPGEHVLHTGGELAQPYQLPHEIICHITVVAASRAERVAGLIRLVQSSELPSQRKKALIASLATAEYSFGSGQETSGRNQMAAFQHKVQAQIAGDFPSLAAQFGQAAGKIMEQ